MQSAASTGSSTLTEVTSMSAAELAAPDSRATAQCSKHSRLTDHNELEFRLDFDQLQSAEEIDEGFRSLVKSFTVPTK